MTEIKEFGVPQPGLPEPKKIKPLFTLREPLVEVDPITYEIVKHRIWYAGLTLGETLKKVSGTIVTAEANDMSIYITLEDGAPVFLGPYVIFHSGIADLIVSNVIKLNKDDPGIRDGDMFFMNDPWLGMAHQCDCAIVSPIFVDGELYLWSGVTVHQLDMGGVNPGGLCPDARDAYAEPTLYPAIKIVENNELRADIDRLLRRNSRLPGIVALDIRSMVAANNAAKRDLMILVEQYGKDLVKSVMIMMQNKTSEMFKEKLAKLPRGKFRSRDCCEIGGAAPELQDEVNEVQVTITNTGEKLIVDYTGTSRQSGGFANCGIGGLKSGSISGFVEPVAYDIPWNAGLMANIEMISQEGTLNNPTFPAAVSDGITEGAITTGAAVSKATANWLLGNKEYREKTLATSGAVLLGNTLGGLNPQGQMWGTLLMDVIGMASAGIASRDGLDLTGSGGIPFTQFSNVETNELHYPLLYLYRRLHSRGWGHGYNRGGRAIELAFKPHNVDFIYMLLWHHGAEFPSSSGASGGLPASAVKLKYAQNSDILKCFEEGFIPQEIEEFPCVILPAKGQNFLGPNDIVQFSVPGGAGYGDPIKREPERVLADVANKILSPEDAKKFYGVLIREEDLQVDEAGTKKELEKIIETRLKEGRFPHEWGELVPPDLKKESISEVRSRDSLKPLESEKIRELFKVGMGRKVVKDDSTQEIFWTCHDCDHLYCKVDENPKLHSKMRVGYLNEMAHSTAQMTRLDSPRFFFRQFYCPQCGTMWDTEVARPEDPILSTIEYDMEWLQSL